MADQQNGGVVGGQSFVAHFVSSLPEIPGVNEACPGGLAYCCPSHDDVAAISWLTSRSIIWLGRVGLISSVSSKASGAPPTEPSLEARARAESHEPAISAESRMPR